MVEDSHSTMSENVKHETQLWYKWKAVIRFLTHEGITLRESFCREVDFGDETTGVSKAWAWAGKADAGPMNLFAEPCSGCSKMQQSVEVNNKLMKKFIKVEQ